MRKLILAAIAVATIGLAGSEALARPDGRHGSYDGRDRIGAQMGGGHGSAHRGHRRNYANSGYRYSGYGYGYSGYDYGDGGYGYAYPRTHHRRHYRADRHHHHERRAQRRHHRGRH